MITGRTKSVSVHTQPGQMGSKSKTLVNNINAKNMLTFSARSKQTEIEIKMGASGTVGIVVKRGGKLLFAQNV